MDSTDEAGGKQYVVPVTGMIEGVLEGEWGNHIDYVFTFRSKTDSRWGYEKGKRYPLTKPLVRMYWENWQRRWTPSHGGARVVDAPTGVTLFVPDLPPGASTDWLADYFDLRFLRESPVGGHFAAAEQPQRIVEDVREFFRPLR